MSGFRTTKAMSKWEVETADSDEPMKALWAVAILDDILDDDDAVQANWPKLARRHTGLVRYFIRRLKEAKPEMRQTMLTEFAKTYPVREDV